MASVDERRASWRGRPTEKWLVVVRSGSGAACWLEGALAVWRTDGVDLGVVLCKEWEASFDEGALLLVLLFAEAGDQASRRGGAGRELGWCR